MGSDAARLLLFTGVSLALHALTLGAYTPSAAFLEARPASSSGTAMHGVLIRSSAMAELQTSDAPESYDGEKREAQLLRSATLPQNIQNDEPDATSEVRVRESGRFDFLTTDKWYKAEDLDSRAEPLTAVKLGYPYHLSGIRMAGRVQLALFIDEAGLVRKAQVIESRPERLFDDVAIKAWLEVRFVPALKNGQPVKSEKLLEIDFTPE